MFKVLFICDRCKELHRVDTKCLIIVKPDMGVKVVGRDNLSDEQKRNLGRDLPMMLTHVCQK